MPTRLYVVRRSLSTALVLAAASAGCGKDPATDPDVDPDVDPTDETAPLVVDTMPAADATGVAANEKVFVTFSERMDPATVEAAYSSVQLPLDKVSLAWNPDGTVLTISPDTPLAYAEGTGTAPAAVTALTYVITIGAGAADLAGNTLGAPLELSFATRRRLVAAFAIDLALSTVSRNSSLQGTSDGIWVGDNAVDNVYRGYVSFNLTSLPPGSEIESAQFSARQLAPVGTPYGMGPVVAQHLTFPTLNNLGAVQALSLPGTFSADAVFESKLIDVTPQVQDDVANRAARGNRSQYRLQIDQASNNDGITDRAVFATNTFEMTAVYVVD
jgi:hypothetical protein